MGLFSKLKDVQKNNAIWFGYSLQNVGGIPTDGLVGIKMKYEEKVVSIKSGDHVVTIPFNRVVGFDSEDAKTIEKRFSAGGAIVGGALFGPVGAIIGSSKNKKEHKWFASLRFIGKDGSMQELCFREKNDDWKISQQTILFKKLIKDVAVENGNGSSTTEL